MKVHGSHTGSVHHTSHADKGHKSHEGKKTDDKGDKKLSEDKIDTSGSSKKDKLNAIGSHLTGALKEEYNGLSDDEKEEFADAIDEKAENVGGTIGSYLGSKIFGGGGDEELAGDTANVLGSGTGSALEALQQQIPPDVLAKLNELAQSHLGG